MSSAKAPFLEADEEVEVKQLPAAYIKGAARVSQQPIPEQPDPSHNIQDADDGLAVLPPELLHLIFHFMGPRDLAAARMVCRQALHCLDCQDILTA